MSVALNIIDIVNENVKKSHALRVNEIELDIGKFSGIEPDALKFALETAVTGTNLENSIIKIKTIDPVGFCRNCSEKFEMINMYQSCPGCNSYEIDILSGSELSVKSLNVD